MYLTKTRTIAGLPYNFCGAGLGELKCSGYVPRLETMPRSDMSGGYYVPVSSGDYTILSDIKTRVSGCGNRGANNLCACPFAGSGTGGTGNG